MAVDPTNTYYKNGSSSGVTLDFYHVPSARRVTFKAFLTQMDDTFDAKYNREEVYGRMDAFQIFQGTTRSISISWQIPAYSPAEAKENLRRCSLLASMQYPVYERTGRARGQASSIKGTPIIKIKFANLITSNVSIGGTAETSGLAGAMSGLQFSPNIDAGFVIDNSSGQTMMYPKLLDLSCQFAVIHQHSLGWQQDGNARGRAMKRFPYNINNTNTLSTDTPRSPTGTETITQARIEEAFHADNAAEVEEFTSSESSDMADELMMNSINSPATGLMSDTQLKLNAELRVSSPRKYTSNRLDISGRDSISLKIRSTALERTLIGKHSTSVVDN